MNTEIKDLTQWQEKFPMGFEVIAVDITGFCNAKCKYCPSGNDLSHRGQFMDIQKYKSILKKLIEYKMLTSNTNFHIYALGEPLLHPNLDGILSVNREMDIKTIISTNASIIPSISQKNIGYIKRVLISMPGFSQDSYNRIHGFNFEKIKANVIALREQLNTVPFDMTYHIYQFNQNEIENARKFCDKYNIRFAPNYAVLFDKNKCIEYVNNQIPYEELKQMSKELLLNVLDEQIKASSRDYCVFIETFLSINVDGNVRVCNCFSKEYEKNITCGNILEDNIDDILNKKYHFAYCNECIKLGLTLGEGYDCKVFPDYYFDLLKENEYYKTCLKDEELKDAGDKIAFMHQVRKWENHHYSNEQLNELIELMNQLKLNDNEIKNIITQYARFRNSTYEKLSNILNN